MTIDFVSLPSFDTVDPMDSILSPFCKGAILIDRALTALATIGSILETIESNTATDGFRADVTSLRAAVGTATFEGDNLLAAQISVGRPLIIFALARQPSGALKVQPIDIGREAMAIAPMVDGMDAAVAAGARASLPRSIRQAKRHVAAATSRLSVVKTRLDLQSTFLASIRDADPGAQIVRLDDHLNQDGAREMALATRRLLGRQSLNIANANKKKLEALFKRYAADAPH